MIGEMPSPSMVTVAPGGVVYGQNPKWLLDKFAEKPWAERLAKPVALSSSCRTP